MDEQIIIEKLPIKDEKEQQKKKRKYWLLLLLLLLLLGIAFLWFREDTPSVFIRAYEEHVERQYGNAELGENARLNIAVSQKYEISEKIPYFYIGYPENNEYDIILTFGTEDGTKLYQTNYIAPGTNVKIPGIDFVEKGTKEYYCNIAVYELDTGKLVSDTINVIMKIQYE